MCAQCPLWQIAMTLSVRQGVQVQDWFVISPIVMWLFSGSPVEVNFYEDLMLRYEAGWR